MINIYGQKHPHDNVNIIGTYEDLKAFIHALDQAIYFENNTLDIFDSEGEEYTIKFKCISEDEISKLSSPYRTS